MMTSHPAQTDIPNPSAPQSGLHLYHFPLSSCSQKVRLILEEKGAKWTSHVILLPAFEQYDPDYVRINPRCVVPTLVRDGLVTTDSLNILTYVDQHLGSGASMVPAEAEQAALMKQLIEVADTLPLEAATYGPLPDVKKPFLLRRAKGTHEKKVALLRKRLEEHKADEVLSQAYQAKLEKVEQVKETIHTPEKMEGVVAALTDAVAQIEQHLDSGPFGEGGWLCSKEYSLADVEWAVLLYRFQWLGLGDKLWGQRKHVAAYAQRLIQRAAFQRAVVGWNQPLTKVVLPLLRKRLFG